MTNYSPMETEIAKHLKRELAYRPTTASDLVAVASRQLSIDKGRVSSVMWSMVDAGILSYSADALVRLVEDE